MHLTLQKALDENNGNPWLQIEQELWYRLVIT